MKRERLTVKRKIQKKIELRHKNLIFINTKGEKRMNEHDMLRIYGKVLPVATPIVNPVVTPVTGEVIKANQIFSLSRPIPRRIFFYWGGSNLSWMRYMTLYSFRKMNPDWEIVLYISSNDIKNKGWKSYENQDYHQYKGDNYFNKLKDLNIKIEKAEFSEEVQDKLKGASPIHESDLFRYYQLFVGGGFYCDMDVLFFRPIDDFYNKIIDGGYDTIIHEYESSHDWLITIGFLGASINNEFYKNLFEFGINNYLKNTDSDYQAMGIRLIYKMFKRIVCKNITNIIISKYPNLKFYNLSTAFIYNFDWTKIKYCFTNSFGTNQFAYDSIGYHWFGGGVESQKYNGILNENNYLEYKTTFSKIADEIINMKIDKNGYVILKNNKKPKISIVTAYYNRKNVFHETLKSIAKSKFKDFELIAVDDNSLPEERIEEFVNEFPFLRVIRIEPENKWYVNSSVPYNIGIRDAVGDIIILQNPECLHVHDILSYVNENINDATYITMSAYALDKKQTEKLHECCNNNTVIDFFKDLPQQTCDPVVGWYNHTKFRPKYYHFCSAITKVNMDKLNGFDERYANGVEYEDNEFLERVKRLGLNLIIKDNISVIHQNHPTSFYALPNIKELCKKNRLLFEGVTMLETGYKAK